MKKLILFCFIMLSFFGFSQNTELFDEANSAYQKGDYEVAISKYEMILEEGETSAELYFNLGNAHYKLNHVGPSIYYYEKALQLDPGDEDIENNIEFARNMVIDDIEKIEQTGFSMWFNNFVSTFSYTTWAVMAIIYSVFFVILFLLYYYASRSLYKRVFFTGAMICVVCCVISVTFAFQQQSYVQDNQYAIIFEEEVEVRDEPTLRGEASFQLHEGTKAKILEDYQEWSRIELSNGAQGWVNSDKIKML